MCKKGASDGTCMCVHIITMALGKSSGSGVAWAWRKRRGNFGPFRASDVVGENVRNRRCAIRWKLITHTHTESLYYRRHWFCWSRRSHQTQHQKNEGRWTHVLPPPPTSMCVYDVENERSFFFFVCHLSLVLFSFGFIRIGIYPPQLRQIIINNGLLAMGVITWLATSI